MLEHFATQKGMHPKDDMLLLMEIALGRAVSQNGQLPTEEERAAAERMLNDWNRRYDELWERNPEEAAKVVREISARIVLEQSQRK